MPSSAQRGDELQNVGPCSVFCPGTGLDVVRLARIPAPAQGDAMAIPWVIALNLWWILPFLQAYTGGVERSRTPPSPTPPTGPGRRSTIRSPTCLDADRQLGLVPAPVPAVHEALDRPSWIWIRYLIPALVFAAPGRTSGPAPGGHGAAGFVWGLRVPGQGPHGTAVRRQPLAVSEPAGFWLFREPMSKLGRYWSFSVRAAHGDPGRGRRSSLATSWEQIDPLAGMGSLMVRHWPSSGPPRLQSWLSCIRIPSRPARSSPTPGRCNPRPCTGP